MVGLFWYTSQMCLVQFLFAQIFNQTAVKNANNCYFLSDIFFVILPRIFRRFWRLVLSSAGVPRINCQVNALTNCAADTFPKKLPSLIHSLSSALQKDGIFAT